MRPNQTHGSKYTVSVSALSWRYVYVTLKTRHGYEESQAGQGREWSEWSYWRKPFLIRSLLLLLFHNRICTAQCVVVTARLSVINNKKRSGHTMRSLVSGILRRHIRQWGTGTRGCHSTVTMTGSAMDANTVFHLDRYSRSVYNALTLKVSGHDVIWIVPVLWGRQICSLSARRGDNEQPIPVYFYIYKFHLISFKSV